MRVSPALACFVLLTSAACMRSITEYGDELSTDPTGDGDGDPSGETGTATGDGDGDPGDGDGDPTTGDGDGDGDPTTGDGDGDCKPGTAECVCDAGKCEAGYECLGGLCTLSNYPWGKCGWDVEKMWYACGFQGESSDPQLPIDCGDLPLVSGAPCPAELTLQGCCAYGGDAWWCENEKVVRDPCGG